jgi:hypothetical protein
MESAAVKASPSFWEGAFELQAPKINKASKKVRCRMRFGLRVFGRI